MKNPFSILSLLLLFLVPMAVIAEDLPPNLEPLPAPPDAIDEDLAEDDLDREILIKEGKDGEKIEEFRIDGKLYVIKITPAIGPPYYIIDHDGDGHPETRMDDLNRIQAVEWKLWEF
ncbi:MAG: DUF2782 domain-containing protein [Candidatus Eutrophobiaceae bacterium]